MIQNSFGSASNAVGLDRTDPHLAMQYDLDTMSVGKVDCSGSILYSSKGRSCDK